MKDLKQQIAEHREQFRAKWIETYRLRLLDILAQGRTKGLVETDNFCPAEVEILVKKAAEKLGLVAVVSPDRYGSLRHSHVALHQEIEGAEQALQEMVEVQEVIEEQESDQLERKIDAMANGCFAFLFFAAIFWAAFIFEAIK